MTDPNQRLIAWQTKTDAGRRKEMLDTLRPRREPYAVSRMPFAVSRPHPPPRRRN